MAAFSALNSSMPPDDGVPVPQSQVSPGRCSANILVY